MPAATKTKQNNGVDFGKRLAQMRRDRKLTQADIGLGADIALTTISKQERTKNCHLRPNKLRDFANLLHSVAPLSDDELETLRVHGSVGEAFVPVAEHAKRLTPELDTAATCDQLERAFPGQARLACKLVHEQILGEAAATSYLQILCEAASRLGVAVVIPDE